MAAKNEDVSVTTSWTALTNAITTSTTLTIINKGKADVILMATAGSAPSSSSEDGIPLEKNSPGIVGASLAILFPGVTSATKLFARTVTTPDTKVFVSHEA